MIPISVLILPFPSPSPPPRAVPNHDEREYGYCDGSDQRENSVRPACSYGVDDEVYYRYETGTEETSDEVVNGGG